MTRSLVTEGQSTDKFLQVLRLSQILSETEIDRYLEQLEQCGPLPGEARDLARGMIKDGLLTYFQVDQLLKGKHKNFLFAAKYKVLERIGSGATGHVYLCEHPTMQRMVALKVLPNDLLDHPAILERFYREARILATLDHPNIVRAFDNGQHGKTHYIVMEYVYGTTLQNIISNNGKMGPDHAVHYIHQAALGLQHLHEAVLVHRDIKPSNLILDRHGTVKIIDLGLARKVIERKDDITRRCEPTAILGTADFLSPEQAINSSEVDIRTDIYSLGMTWYFLLAGKTPFADGKTAHAKILMHQLRKPTPIREIRNDLPEGMIALLEKMMEKDPDKRPASPAQVVRGLAPWINKPIEPPGEDDLPLLCPAVQKVVFPTREPVYREATPAAKKFQVRTQEHAQTITDPPSTRQFEKPTGPRRPVSPSFPSRGDTSRRQDSTSPGNPDRPRRQQKRFRRTGRVIAWVLGLALIGIAAGIWATQYQAASPESTTSTLKASKGKDGQR
jgi:serine/threonine protein kinase